MAKSVSPFTFEQLELALESSIGFENDERSLPKEPSNNQEPSRRGHNKSSSGQHQINRNHYHYCNVHFHQNKHPNHHHNRSNHHQHFYQQEVTLNVDENYTLDQTEFDEVWREMETDKDRYNFLKSLYHAATPSGNLIFSDISFGSLGDMASALAEFDDTVDDFCFVVYILNSLSHAKRFLLSLQFMTCEERQECKRLFHKLWKSMSDKQQDLAENNITELTLNELMKTYEIEQ